MTARTAPTDLEQAGARLDALTGVDVWASVPAVRDARERANRMSSVAAACTTAVRGDTLGQVAGAAVDSLLNGAQLDAKQLRDDLAEAQLTDAAGAAVSAAVAARSISVRGDVVTAETGAADTALTALNAHVVELVDVTRALVRIIDGPTESSDAAGRTWQARSLLEQAVHIHDAFRGTQVRVLTAAGVDPSVTRQFGTVRSVETLTPWVGWLRAGSGAYGDTTLAGGATLFDDVVLNGGERLLRLVAHLDPWVPTRAQLATARRDMTLRVEQARYARRTPDATTQRAPDGPVPTITGAGLPTAMSIPSRTLGAGRV